MALNLRSLHQVASFHSSAPNVYGFDHYASVIILNLKRCFIYYVEGVYLMLVGYKVLVCPLCPIRVFVPLSHDSVQFTHLITAHSLPIYLIILILTKCAAFSSDYRIMFLLILLLDLTSVQFS